MKAVLLSFLDRNKVVKIPEGIDGSELDYIRKQCKTLFSFQQQVSIKITLQRFSEDWNEFVNLEEGDTLKDKEKLKIVITPHLQTPDASECDHKVNLYFIYNNLYIILVMINFEV